LDRLWSPWRLEYITRTGREERREKQREEGRNAGCIFCLESQPAENRSLVVFEGRACYVILNLYPYNNGHLMVVPRRHVGSLAALSADEMVEVGVLTQRCETALDAAYRPQGFNIGVNLGKSAGAGVLDHVHVHVVPRWSGDTNFMTVVGDMRVLPESLGESAARLRPIFSRLAGSR
jgi:ATP adenylyltransferase